MVCPLCLIDNQPKEKMNNTSLYPILSLRDIAVYPQVVVPLFVGRPKSIKALDKAMENSQELLLVPQKDPNIVDPEPDALHDIAAFGRIVQLAKLSDGTVKVLVEGISRVKVENIQDNGEFFEGSFERLEDEWGDDAKTLTALSDGAISDFSAYLKSHERNADELIETLRQLEDGGRVADTIAAHMDIPVEARINILRTLNIQQRLEQILILLEEDKDKSKLEQTIKKRVKEQMDKNQREYYLNEKIKAIQKELNELDDLSLIHI